MTCTFKSTFQNAWTVHCPRVLYRFKPLLVKVSSFLTCGALVTTFAINCSLDCGLKFVTYMNKTHINSLHDGIIAFYGSSCSTGEITVCALRGKKTSEMWSNFEEKTIILEIWPCSGLENVTMPSKDKSRRHGNVFKRFATGTSKASYNVVGKNDFVLHFFPHKIVFIKTGR